MSKAEAPAVKKPSSVASAVSGAISGSLISACVQPLDVIRTKMQGDAAQGIARSTLGTAVEVVRAGGVRGLWQGTGPSVIRVGLGAGLHFLLLEQFKAALSSQQQAEGGKAQLSHGGNAIAGGLSRAVAAILLCPITVIKTRMEYTHTSHISLNGPTPPIHQYKNTMHALLTIGRTEGLAGLFQGLVPTVLTNAPFSALYYMFYSEMKNRLTSQDRPQALVNFTAGCISAVAATVLTQPTDVVRTRMQLGYSNANSLVTLLAVCKQGASALMTGVGPRILKRTTQTALVWTLYEELYPRLSAFPAWVEKVVISQEQKASVGGKSATGGEGQTGAQGSSHANPGAKGKPLLTNHMTPLDQTDDKN